MQNHSQSSKSSKEIQRAEQLAQFSSLESMDLNQVIYSDRDISENNFDTLELFQKNLAELEDTVGRLKVTMRDVRFQMKLD